MPNYTILGAGIAGLSSSYHLGHENCRVIEQNATIGGHTRTNIWNNTPWDEGPHISFTKNEYVQELFSKSVNGEYFEESASVSNYHKGDWIPHPAQTNMAFIPEPLRSLCYQDFLDSHNQDQDNKQPANYGEWLDNSLGNMFSKTFPRVYTEKYWRASADELSIDWVGNRMLRPNKAQVKRGYERRTQNDDHYITLFRYPRKGGFLSFLSELSRGVNVKVNTKVSRIDLERKKLFFSDGTSERYDRLINTIPLVEFMRLAAPPPVIRDASEKLKCTSVLLINLVGVFGGQGDHHWMYVYDSNYKSTRITNVSKIAQPNQSIDQKAIQVEVYFSNEELALGVSFDLITKQVCDEVQEMNILSRIDSCQTQFIRFANIVFDLNRRAAQDQVFGWLEQFGLHREPDDLEPTTRWDDKELGGPMGDLMLAGRYGQWKYFWTDDCVLRGRQIANAAH